MKIRTTEEIDEIEKQREAERAREKMLFQHAETASLAQEASASAAESGGQGAGPAGVEKTPFVRDGQTVGRNDPCYCGSGKKFKQCHGKLS